MSMHAVISGWLLGPHSGANKRLLAVLAAAGNELRDDERITVLHRPEFEPLDLHRVEWLRIEVPTKPTWKRVMREQFLLGKALQQRNATVYDHGFLPPPSVPVPTCLTIHDLRAVDGHSRWPSAFARAVVRKSCRRVNAIVTPSDFTAQRVREIVPAAANKLVVVQNAAHLTPTGSTKLTDTLPTNGYLLHVGHLEPRKNLDLIIRALAHLPTSSAPELWLAGNDAGSGSDLKRLANELGIATRIKQLGAVDDGALGALYESCAAVVMPSIYEGFGMPALEGLAYGKPVLASDKTALPEVLGGHGWLLPTDQPKAWSQAIITALAEPADRGQNPEIIERVRYGTGHWTWRAAAAAYVSTWRRLSAAKLEGIG